MNDIVRTPIHPHPNPSGSGWGLLGDGVKILVKVLSNGKIK
jgi:hypothetical protein